MRRRSAAARTHLLRRGELGRHASQAVRRDCCWHRVLHEEGRRQVQAARRLRLLPGVGARAREQRSSSCLGSCCWGAMCAAGCEPERAQQHAVCCAVGGGNPSVSCSCCGACSVITQVLEDCNRPSEMGDEGTGPRTGSFEPCATDPRNGHAAASTALRQLKKLRILRALQHAPSLRTIEQMAACS